MLVWSGKELTGGSVVDIRMRADRTLDPVEGLGDRRG